MPPSTIGARPASAVVVARSGRQGVPEMMFVKRPQSMRFLAGFHAFVGGGLNEDDSSPHAARLSALSGSSAATALGKDAADVPPLAFYVCALRELFEEVGIFLAHGGAKPRDGELEEARRLLLAGKINFSDVHEQFGTRMATDALRYHHRWLAPEALPVRFDLRVFLAKLDGDPIPHDAEVESIHWHTASEMLALSEAGAVMMAPPTIATVVSLMSHESLDGLMAGEAVVVSDPVVEVHSPLVRRIVAPNASIMTGPGTNTYIVGRSELVVIDPGSMDKQHLKLIASQGPLRLILLTHGHPDHLSGALELAGMTGAEVGASSVFWERSFLKPWGPSLEDGDVVELDEGTLRVLFTPGHSADHLCFWLEEEASLFTGDLVLGEGTTVISPPNGNLVEYMDSLDKVAALKPALLYPGHFPPRADARAWIDWYINHRIEREQQILNAIGNRAVTVLDIVAIVYAGYPLTMQPIAARSVVAHLDKLVAEGRVSAVGDEFTVVKSD